MPKLDLTQATSTICDFLQDQLPGLMGVYVFGSQAQSTAGPDSDLDLAVLVAGYVEPLTLWDLGNDLAGRLNIDVDLLDLRAATTVMQHQVITGGTRGEPLAHSPNHPSVRTPAIRPCPPVQ